ncbi:uncharacterized protein LOC114524913 isoform X2 [Dendronephthya gigantea]|uniref:uncharacterized protein LOC114524913 isoform X2 n=1 Tax=Dendronephthya gigantea TaxID=151771 RepID=UPI00106A7DB3|nr:uncharacterized protein LOC114524913 isoform X2 [Dendronephthya gigantea]
MSASIIGTWSFSVIAVKEIVSRLENGDSILDAIEKGINVVEDDPNTGKNGIGRGGFPNEDGILECDAAIMDGDGCKFGAVAAVQGIATPISVAKLVMKRSQHSILVGKGAQQFAKDHGVPVLSNELLQTENSIEAYKEFMRKKQKESHDCTAIGHDTIGVLVKDFQGNFAAGTSTSGMPFKSCGRVGDSPLPGAGLYADNEVGAAAASGDGDHILRFCPSFQVVQHMRNGMHPKEACKRVIMDIWRRVGENKMFEIALIAINSEDLRIVCGIASRNDHHVCFASLHLCGVIFKTKNHNCLLNICLAVSALYPTQ